MYKFNFPEFSEKLKFRILPPHLHITQDVYNPTFTLSVSSFNFVWITSAMNLIQKN